MKSHALKSTLLAALILVVSRFIPALEELSTATIWMGVVLFYSALNILFLAWLKKAQNSSPLGFSVVVNGMTAAKMFITLGIITVYVVAEMPEKTQFALAVFAVFVCNSALFVIDTQKIIRKG